MHIVRKNRVRRAGNHIRAPKLSRWMDMNTILLVVLILLLVGALPTWPHSNKWGYAPSGLLGTVLVIILILMLLGRL